MKKVFTAVLALSLAAFCIEISDRTIVRFGAMGNAPQIDGRIEIGEWDYACSTFGGITPATGIMTYRECNFRLGYDLENLYFASTSEIPIPPQVLTSADQVELRLKLPGAKKPISIHVDSTGKGNLPEGTMVANGFHEDVLTSFLRKCWTIEMAIPLKSLDVKSIGEDKAAWGVQMMRHWDSMPETSVWHLGKDAEEMGTFIPDQEAPVISFDGFGHNAYRESGNYCWPHRIENRGNKPVTLASESTIYAFSNPPTLDMINLEQVGDAKRVAMAPRQLTIPPGGTDYVDQYLMAQFKGSTRQVQANIKDKATGTVYYRRNLYWDVAKAQKHAIYKDDKGLPYLCAGFYPSYGNKLHFACVYSRKLPCLKTNVEVKDEKGTVLKSFSYSNSGKPLDDVEEEMTLPNLPKGKYLVTMDTVDAQGSHYGQTRTFEIASFPWQGNQLGLDRVIIPPFKPLQVKKEANEVHALMTGYHVGGELWDKVYSQEALSSERENILAAPVRFVLNGRHFDRATVRLVSQEEDKVIYETTSYLDETKMVIVQEYDFDGFCKADVRLYPKGPLRVDEFALEFTLKDDVVQFYSSINHEGPRSGNAPDLTIPRGEGVLDLKGCVFPNGRPVSYIWLGGIYKGFCIMNDSQRHFSLDQTRGNIIVSRKGKGVTCRYDIVNKCTSWQEPVSFTFGFEPTPVKPQVEGIRAIGEYMYDYPQPKGAVWATMRLHPSLLNNMLFPPETKINHDDSFFEHVFTHRGKAPESDTVRLEFAKAFMARNESWLRKNMPTVSLPPLLKKLHEKRVLGVDYFICYNDPLLYSCLWPEAEMYKAEWLPWDYPADDAINEYVCTHNRSYQDRLLWIMRENARRGWDGMNFDCFPLGGGFNTTVTEAFRTGPGKVPNLHNANMLQTAPAEIAHSNSLFSWRELTRRAAIMLYMEGKSFMGYPWVELHTTHCQCVPVTAFCTTTITWERSSRGDEYPVRYPYGFIMAETAGTQSGTIPRCIVSTHPNKTLDGLRIAETLVSTSFSFGLLNHVDQGVVRGSKDYQLWRDYVFEFGYARPENKTLTFYGHERQPVICAARNILTTQVIRPDGKALVLIGNSADATTAIFDVSALNYGKCRFTDVKSGNVLEKPKLDIGKYSYGMLLIEKQ